LLGESGEPVAGKTALLDLPQAVVPAAAENLVSLRGPLTTAGSIVDSFMLAYAEGLPLTDVGWGRITPERLTELLELHALWFELAHATLYPAQAETSNLASHLLDTLQQAATGRPVSGAIGAPGEKLVFLAGHDVNQIGLGALLGATWWLPGTQPNPVLLGGALVFELRERPGDHQLFIRVLYLSPSLEQTRALTPLTLDQPPGIAPIFIPGCSDPAPGYDAPLAKFDAHLRAAIDPRFVKPGPP
jgi:4-phytase/acid phosphatase